MNFRTFYASLLVAATVWVTCNAALSYKANEEFSKIPTNICKNPGKIFERWFDYPEVSTHSMRSSFSMKNSGWLSLNVCNAGIIKIKMRGKALSSVGPFINISLNGDSLFDGEILDTKILTLRIPKPGNVTIAYTNDQSERDVRSLLVNKVSFSSVNCDLRIAGKPWGPGKGVLVLVDSPVEIDVCENGTINMDIQGRKGGGLYPELRVLQNDKIIYDQTFNMVKSSISFYALRGAAKLKLINPYNRLISDRSFYVDSLEYYDDLK